MTIRNYQWHDRLVTPCPEAEVNWLEYHFHLTGEHQTEHFSLGAGQWHEYFIAPSVPQLWGKLRSSPPKFGDRGA